MPVDVETGIEIARPREEVAAYACDPDNATAWYENIEAVAWETPPPLAVGSRVAFVASFLGRRLAYTYEIVELVPGERLVMRTAEGPVPDGDDLHVRGRARRRHADDAAQPRRASGFAKVGAPVMAAAMRRANRKDLAALRAVLEGREGLAGAPARCAGVVAVPGPNGSPRRTEVAAARGSSVGRQEARHTTETVHPSAAW